ncbi:MAG: succinylglutamate desuccinylase [Methyloligellaceae bacterium]
MPSPSLPNTNPIELQAPDIEPYRAGNTGVDYVTTFDSGAPGPHVMISAIVHGNELCGPVALDWLFRQDVRPRNGRLTLAFVNVAAYGNWDPDDPFASRWVDEDFNRLWARDVLEGDRTSLELERARALRPLLDTVDLLLDIHSMQTPSPPLMMAGPLPKGRVLAREVGVPDLVVTDRGHAAGRRMRDYAGFAEPESPKNALLVECGQHWAAPAGDLAIETAVRFLRATGIVEADLGLEAAPATATAQRFIEVTEGITIKSEIFTFAREFQGGEVIPEAGTLLGHDGEQPVHTPYDHCVLIMPTRRTYRGQTAVRIGKFVEV